MKPQRTQAHVTEKRTQPFDYPAGTRVVSCAFDWECYPGDGVIKTFREWKHEYGEFTNAEDMFVTISWTTPHMHVEVSDRMKKDDQK